jgi:predicted signal transduction protein with EAL and GGDEF domain
MNEPIPAPGEIVRLRRRLQRERDARLEAERIAEQGLRALYEQRQDLELLEAIAAASNSGESIAEVFGFALAQICQFKNWAVGHAYLVVRAGENERLASTPIWHVHGGARVAEFRQTTEIIGFDKGVGLPGRIWVSGKAAWIADLFEDPNFPRAAAARAAGLRSAFGFPVMVGTEVAAVLEFFAEKPVAASDELLRLVAHIGAQLGRVVERKHAQDKLVHDASHDPLTGLPNRALLRDRLARAVARARRNPSRHYAVLFVDLDRFKMINDSLGHLAGDRVIVQVASRLLAALRNTDLVAHPPALAERDEEDTLARLGGDEFIVLLDDLAQPGDAMIVVERIQHALKHPFRLDERELYTTASIGVASSATGYESADDVLRDADIAMYRAKQLGRARCEVYDQAMHASALRRFSVESDLRAGIERNELVLHYQPLVSLRTGRIAGFEALVRWRRGGGPLVFPGDFIDVAEDSGLIVEIGQWVLNEACSTIERWRKTMPDASGAAVSVNVSARQFAQPDLIDQVRRVVRECAIAPDLLTLEITESVTMGEVERTVAVLSQLKAIGVELSIDDFGTGYSSLSYLHRFPVDVLKIDRSFISKMDEAGEGYQIVHTIMALARTLGMDVVAEGAETAKQIALLAELGCAYAQGYYFSRPVDAEKAAALLVAPPFTVPAAFASDSGSTKLRV